MDKTINANLSKCIQSVDHFGYTTYHNICSGAHVDLQWGFGSWATFCAVSLAVLLLLFALGGLAKVFLDEL